MDTKINSIFVFPKYLFVRNWGISVENVKNRFEPKTVLFVFLTTRQNLQVPVVEPSVVQILTSLKKASSGFF